MCRGKNEPCGGRRCPSSAMTRQARSALEGYSTVIAASLTPALPATVTPGSGDVSQLRERTESLREKIRSAGDSPSSEFDAEVELELQQVGEDFIAVVEGRVEFGEDYMFEELDSRLGEVFEAGEMLPEVRHQLSLSVEGSAEHAELTARVALLEDMEADDEKYVKLIEKELFAKVAESYRQAYIEVLSEIRPLGADMEAVEVDGDRADLEAQLENTVFKHYPTEWLQRHKELGVMYVSSDNSPVHYNQSSPDSRGDRLEKNSNFKTITAPDDEAKAYLQDSVLRHYRIVADGTPETKGSLIVYDLPEEELAGFDKSVRPDGEGWEFRTSMTHALEFKYEESFADEMKTERWVRVTDKAEPVVPKLNFYSVEEAEELGEEHTSAVLYHEFGHRMEYALPDRVLPRLEKAFLLRRSGKTESEQHERLTKNLLGDEYYHRADFVDKYVGREYFTGESYEVFATGVEAIFGKKFSGLIGLDSDCPRRDEDHRRFTLGALATL